MSNLIKTFNMKASKFFFALIALSILFVSCSPNSIADEDNLYDNQQGIDKRDIFVPRWG